MSLPNTSWLMDVDFFTRQSGYLRVRLRRDDDAESRVTSQAGFTLTTSIFDACPFQASD